MIRLEVRASELWPDDRSARRMPKSENVATAEALDAADARLSTALWFNRPGKLNVRSTAIFNCPAFAEGAGHQETCRRNWSSYDWTPNQATVGMG